MNKENDLQLAGQISHLRPLGSLAEKVRPGHTALLVVDMQNDFCAPGGLVSQDGRDISAAEALVKRLPAFIAEARAAGVLVVFVRCLYTTAENFYLSDVWLEQAARKRKGGYTRIPVCREGSWEGDFSGDVRPEAGDPVVTKHRYSAFHNTDLDTILRANAIRTLVLTGVVSNVCVETTAREGFVRDYYIVAPADGAAAYVEADHLATMSNIDRFFGETTTTAEICACWQSQASQKANTA
ncbi:MAG: isochorismatase family protein [SAR324 cluster bacterium]|nr:isochorismatase family protein [SAR324 cluster bacterium]MCH8888134.1 isochorismatase family protein [SAR324 cluster bacterium]